MGRRLQHKDSLMDCDCLVDCQGAHSHKEGQEDQGEVKELGGAPHSQVICPVLLAFKLSKGL